MTDGQVLGTEKILDDARATNVRLHCLGIGSASQDRFLALLATSVGLSAAFAVPTSIPAAADPPLDPPGTRSRSQGLRTGP